MEVTQTHRKHRNWSPWSPCASLRDASVVALPWSPSGRSGTWTDVLCCAWRDDCACSSTSWIASRICRRSKEPSIRWSASLRVVSCLSFGWKCGCKSSKLETEMIKKERQRNLAIPTVFSFACVQMHVPIQRENLGECFVADQADAAFVLRHNRNEACHGQVWKVPRCKGFRRRWRLHLSRWERHEVEKERLEKDEVNVIKTSLKTL